MLTFITIILLIIAILLIAVVLIQPGKGDMITGMGTVGGSITSMFGTRRASDLLTKTTIGLAIALFVIVIFTNKFFVGNNSTAVVKPITEGMSIPVQTAPVQTAPAPMPTQENQNSENK